jgi:tetratricopeptide (TPR) repeat protein
MLVLASALLAAPGQSAQPGSKSGAATPPRAALLAEATKAQQAGQPAEAMRLLRLAAERHESVQAYLELARLQSRAGDAPAALESLSKARGLAPNSEDVLSAFAQLSLAAKRAVPAVLALESLTRVYPSVAQYHYLLGVGLMAIGEWPSAAESLTEADRLDPDRPLTLLALGLAQNHRKLFPEARTALSRSVELQPESVDALAALAEAEAGVGDLDSASTHARRVLERSPDNATANLVIGMVFAEQRKYDEAREALLKAAAADPDSPKPPYQLSLVYTRLGDEPAARRYLDLYRVKLREVEERLKVVRGEKTP